MFRAPRYRLIPTAFYLAWFVALTWPTTRHFATHLITDTGDGMTNVWNLWWIRKAIVEFHVWPLYTTYLHAPDGTTLLGHTLNPFNGLMAIPLLGVFSMTVAHNIVVLFTFVVGGLTAFALCRYVSGSYWGSLWGGFVFTFSAFHFAHAEGHMQMISLEWIPLFVLCWLRWLDTPTLTRALAAAAALLLVFLCDLYFTLFSVLTAGLAALWWGVENRTRVRERWRDYLRSGVAFACVAAPPIVAFLYALLASNARDPFWGSHDPDGNSMDLLAPFIYGGHWRFSALTRPYWQMIAGNIHESSLHLGWVVIAALVYCGARRRSVSVRHGPRVPFWFVLGGLFALLALGPTLRIWGRPIGWLPMPYDLLVALVPPLRISGAVARFFVITPLAAGVLVAIAFPALRAGLLAGRWRPFLAMALLALEHWPSPLPATRIETPGHTRAIAAAPDGALVDLVTSSGPHVYQQTIHGKPVALGYIARIPSSTLRRGLGILMTARELVQKAEPTAARILRELGFRYVLADASTSVPFLDRLYADDEVIVYDLGPVPAAVGPRDPATAGR
jgi:hypothetical protein